MKVLGDAFDTGHHVLAYSLATATRVLVHDSARSRSNSLLAQAQLLDQLDFHDTSLALNPSNLMPQHSGLVVARITMGVGSKWVPRKSVGPPPAPGAEPRAVPFKDWWTMPVVRDSGGRTWSREEMVLDIANKEGGAHVDPKQPLDVQAIEAENSMAFRHRDPIVGDRPMENGPLLPSIR
jgi:hypothetical protein